MVKIKRSPLKNKKLIVPIVVFLLVFIGAAGFYFTNRENAAVVQAPMTPLPEEKINYDPPTQEDMQRVDDNKQKIVEAEANTPKPSTGPTQPAATPQSTKPIITYAGQYGQEVEVGAYINVFEENGNCTATFTKGSLVVTKSVKSVRGASSTDCPVMSADASEFSQKGTWTVKVNYRSPSTTGVSDPRQVEIK
jgi:hypothetical protein